MCSVGHEDEASDQSNGTISEDLRLAALGIPSCQDVSEGILRFGVRACLLR